VFWVSKGITTNKDVDYKEKGEKIQKKGSGVDYGRTLK
jgi:hypothetical protein